MRGSFNLLSVLVLVFATVASAAPHGIYPTKQMKFLNSILSHKPTTDAPKVLYYGGPVIANVKVYSVYWGANVDAGTTAKIGGFFSATVNSTYMDWLKEYNTSIKAVDGRQGTNQAIGRGSYAGEFTITPKNTSATLADPDIQAEIDLQVAAGALPKPDNNTLFMIYFPAGITITIDGQASCQAFCAYHEGYVSKSFGNVFYGVMPDMGGACSLGCGFQSDPFANMTEVTSHELIEAITDPFPTPGSTPAFPQAWNTTDGNEIGDLCAGNDTQLSTAAGAFTLQQEFDNASNGCAKGPYTTAAQ